MRRQDIIASRRKLDVPVPFKKQWVTLADVGFDGDWVSPIQKISNSMTGPVLVAKHWLDAESVNRHRAVLECLGHLPGIPFNEALDRILESVVSPFTSKQLTLHHTGVPFLAAGRPAEAGAGQIDGTFGQRGDPA